MLIAMMAQRSLSSQRYIVIVRRGKRSMIVLHDRVRKWEGFERTEGRLEITAKRIVFPILA